MRRSRHFLLLGVGSLLLLAGCGSSSYDSTRGTDNTGSGAASGGSTGPGNPIGGGGGLSGTNDLVVSTPSVAAVSAVVGTKQTVTVTFTSSDGKPITGFGISGNLTMLPAGWSGPASFACNSVSSGSGCALKLTYAPTAPANSSLTLNYVFVANSTIPNTTGSFSLPYVAIPADIVQAATSPAGAISERVAVGSQAVSVTFTTNDATTATALTLTTDLATLPVGWSSSSTSFTCAAVSTGTGCQLQLMFAPAVLTSGTLVLSYSYTDDAGTAKTGPAVSIAYAATPPPHLYVAQLNGPLLSCALNNDGSLASCASTGNGFTAPTGIAFYGANFAYVADYTSSAVFLCSVAADGTLSLCSSTGSNFQMPWQLAVQGTTLYATNAAVTGGVTTCAIAADATLSGCTQTSGTGTAGIAVDTSSAYLGVGPTTVNVCAVGAAGALSGCAATGSGFSALDGISLSNGYAYIANEGGASVSVCTVNSTDGTLSVCAASIVGGNPTDVAFDGSRAYVADFASGHMNFCAVGSNGALGSCAVSDGGTTFNMPMNQVAIH